MMIGAAGGVTGGVVGAVPSLIIYHKDIHSIGDVFRMVRQSAITGFGGGFVGAAVSSLRVHQAGRSAFRGEGEPSPFAARHREFAAHINELLRSGEPPRAETIARTSTAGDSAKVVERLTFHDGTEVIRKVVSNRQHAHAEFLTSMVGEAVGARVPLVHVVGDHVYMEVAPGKPAQEAYPRDWNAETRFHGTPSGTRLGVLDALVGMPDRGSENWMVDHPGEMPGRSEHWNVDRTGDVWGIDNSRAFEDTGVIGPFAKQFQEHGPDGEIHWKEHALARSDVHEIRQRVEELRPAFFAAGRRDWHEVMLQRLDILEQHAVGVTGPPAHTPPPVSPPHVAGESRTPAPESNNRRAEGGDRGVSATPRNDLPPPLDQNLRGDRPRTPSRRVGADGTAGIPRTREVEPPVREEVDVPATPEQRPPSRRLRLVDEPPDNAPLPRDEDGLHQSDEPTYDGPPTRPLPRVEPDHGPAYDDRMAAAPPPAGQTMFYRHPDGGYADVVLTGPDGAAVPLRLFPGQEHVLGRGDGALFQDAATNPVSRRHATIKVDENGHVLIHDNESKNGTFVDGKQVVGDTWVRVHDGQKIVLGRTLDIGINFQRQMAEVRLFGDNGPALRLYRGQTIDIGRGMLHPDTPGRMTVSTNHARIGMDENGRVWIEDRGSRNHTRVNNVELAAGEPRTIEPGDKVHLGGYRGEAQFLPPDAATNASPVHLRLGSGPDAVPVRLEPGQSVPIGTDENSPFATQLRDVPGVGHRHATLGLDHDGRLWIRDHPGSEGVWVNGDKITPDQRVTLTEGDDVRIGPDFVAAARLGGDEHPELPPAALHFTEGRKKLPIDLEPGQEVRVNIDELKGNTVMMSLDGKVLSGREIIFGRDADGRTWVHDPNPKSRTEVKVNEEQVPPGEKRYLNADDNVTYEGISTRLQMGEEAPLVLRLSDYENGPVLALRRGDEVLIGSRPDLPMSNQFSADTSVSPEHATIFRDEYGQLWLRDEHSTAGTWVDNVRVDPDARPVQLRPGDQIRFGEWAGAAQFADGYHENAQRLLPVKLNSSHGDISLDIVRGGEPVLLGRDNSSLPTGLPKIAQVSRQHASIGVHPSGRVWIRDEGSLNHTYVNKKEIPPGTKVTLNPGDQVRLANAIEFTVAFPPADGGPFINMMDQTTATVEVQRELGRVRPHIYRRVSEYLNAVPGGGIVIGNRPLLELPGTESLHGNTPYGRPEGTSWNTVQGVYMGGPRRIVINSGGGSGSHNVAWHEFGHATDAAYGTGGRWLSGERKWMDLHQEILRTIGHDGKWNDYYNEPSEAFAEAFTAWTNGNPKQMRKFTLKNEELANKLKDYFDSVLGWHEPAHAR